MSDISTDAMMREAAMMDASDNHVWARKTRRLCIERDTLQARLAEVEADKRWIMEERDRTFALMLSRAEAAEARVKELEAQPAPEVTALVEALREIAAEASVRVEVKKNGGISHKRLYEGWRKIATDRIDIARAALAAMEKR